MKITLPLSRHAALILLSALNFQLSVFGQGTAFTYQGQLQDNGSPANGTYDLRFSLYTVSSGGSQAYGFLTNSDTAVSNGFFTATLDFGAGVFQGTTYWLQIGVRTNGAANFKPLSPRQELTPTPYAVFAEGANAAGLTGTVPPGSVPDSSLSPDVALLDATQTFTGANSFSDNVTLNGNDVYLQAGNTWNGLGYRSSVAGISPSGGEGIFLYGYEAGYLGTRNPNSVALTWDWHNNVTVYGEYLVVNGLTPVNAYIGDDGSGNDVQIGSQKSGVTAVAAYNTADNAYMHFYCSSITIKGGSDLAEPFAIASGKEEVPQGAVVVIDKENPGQLKPSDRPYDTRVAGVVSGANGISPGIQMQQQGLLEGGKNVALTGRVYVRADASNGAIEPGDLLTTSSTPGRAMKVTDHARAQGAILGKAMTGLNKGEGMVLVLVTLQ